MKNFDILDLKSKIIPIARQFDLKLVVLFGSQVTGKTHKESDLDIAVLQEEKAPILDEYRLSVEISQISGFKDVDVVNLRTVGPSILKSTIYGGKVIYEKYPGLFSLERMRAFKIFIEAGPLRALRDRRIFEFLQNH